ncbi:MAG: monovalent cation:proton antiporter-2 (CPA2) family protein, partial [Burkholderiaceae bacterium]
MAAEGTELVKVVTLLAAGVIAVPLFKRIGLGSVLGYLAAGLVIGPSGFGFFSESATILHIAELGVVMFLFVIGLEMQPTKLWALRRQIFGLGLMQVSACGAVLTAAGMLAGLSFPVAFVAAMGFVLTSTAIVMQLLDESGDTSTPRGQRMISILLLEDLAIVPLLALVALLAPAQADTGVPRWVTIAVAVAAIVGLIAVSRWLLNPLFRVLAHARAREVMTAAALLVVLGAALAMQASGLSMAMGAFAAGVMLSESTFRHQLEADIEPFRGILLGLFFMAVGMSLDVKLVLQDWQLLLGGVLAYMVLKGLGIYAVARLTKARHGDALQRAVLMAQGGEFAFVLFSAAATGGIIDANANAAFTATVIISMALTPLVVTLLKRVSPKRDAKAHNLDGVDVAKDLSGTVLVIGFGRFGQIASGLLLARGIDTVIIDDDTDMIRSAANFGFKVYYGDGRRLDVLHASGAATAQSILVCVDGKDTINHIVELCKREFPLTPVLARAFDRQHASELIKRGVTYQLRETFESAIAFGREMLVEMGTNEVEADEIIEDVRSRDAERLELQLVSGLQAGRSLMRGNMPTPRPEPFSKPRRAGRV